MLSWTSLSRPIIALAPMAGYTDTTYRQLVKEICPQVVCFTEFTNVEGILHGNDATMRQIFYNPETERPIVAQLFGKKPESFYKAAEVLFELGVDAIDLNMGCPARKIVSSDHGSALLKNCPLSIELVKATKEGIAHAAARANKPAIPVSVKMRIGTAKYDEEYLLNFTSSMVDAGAELLTIHGRTSKQMYLGVADWNPMYAVKKHIGNRALIIGNGDIKSGADACEKIGNLDGVMVGRGSFGNPWVFLDILAAFNKAEFTPPTLQDKIKILLRHIELSCSFKDEKWGILEMRKHYGWYIKGFKNASDKRKELMALTERSAVENLICSLPTYVEEEPQTKSTASEEII